MNILDIDKQAADPQPVVATIGFFDGVHIGHRYLIEQTKQEAQRRDLPSLVITFPIHPRKVLDSDYQPALLCGYEEKIGYLGTTNPDYYYPLDFTIEISRMSAQQFMQEILKDKLNVSALVVGYDHRFGHNRSEGFNEYKAFGKKIGINVVLAEELKNDCSVSSSAVRRLLAEGNVTKASEYLSYNYTIIGKIVEGFKIGRTIGFPTANMQIWEEYKVIPALGVYAVYAHVDDKQYKAMLYIGKRPTLQNGAKISIEVNLFGFDGDLYGKELIIEFIDFIRKDEKFASLDLLKESIARDKESVLRLLP